jgi:hypothetical protein
MFNDYLANEAAKKHIERRVQEAEAFRRHRRIGADDSKTVRRAALALIMLVGLVLAFAPFI